MRIKEELTMYIAKENINDWNAICKAYAKKVGAELLYVNETSFGLEYPNGTMVKMRPEDLEEALK